MFYSFSSNLSVYFLRLLIFPSACFIFSLALWIRTLEEHGADCNFIPGANHSQSNIVNFKIYEEREGERQLIVVHMSRDWASAVGHDVQDCYALINCTVILLNGLPKCFFLISTRCQAFYVFKAIRTNYLLFQLIEVPQDYFVSKN